MAAPGLALFAHLTDVHVVGEGMEDELHVDNNARLVAAVASIATETPPVDAVLATGDLTAWGRDADYARLLELLAPLDGLVLPLPGNHDDRHRLRAAFPGVPWVDAGHASWVTVVKGVRLVGLDSTRPGEPGAEFDDEREGWLRAVLAETHDGPTVLALHHPPFLTGIDWMDRSGFLGLDRFVRVVADHPVDRIVCGHLHRAVSSTVAGVPVQVGPSTIEAVQLDLRDDARPSLILDPVGYNLLAIHTDSMVTHTRFIDTGSSAFEPGWADLYL